MCVGRAKNYFDGQSRLGAPSAAFLLTQVSLPILRALIAGKQIGSFIRRDQSSPHRGPCAKLFTATSMISMSFLYRS